MFRAVLFVLDQNWKLPKYISTVEWIDCDIFIKTELNTWMRMNDLQLWVTMWLSLTNNNAEQKNPDIKVCVLYDCIYVKDRMSQNNLCFSRPGYKGTLCNWKAAWRGFLGSWQCIASRSGCWLPRMCWGCENVLSCRFMCTFLYVYNTSVKSL